jgi:sugar lactone lactonase YvrE
VYLSDFGVAKAIASAGLTGPGFFVGTPDYAAPEQIQGRAVDGRADQYALACVAFQLLTGVLPFRGDQGQPALLAHVSAPPPSLTAQRPGLPGAVDRVMARAMAKDKEDRYPSCRGFADALREALGLTPFDPEGPATAPVIPRSTVPAGDTGTLTRAKVFRWPGTATRTRPVPAWARRHRLTALALACAALAVIGTVAFVAASPAKSRTAAQPGNAAKTPATARPANPATSANPANYPSVPVKLPSPYAGQGIDSLAFGLGGTALAIADGQHVCLWDVVTSAGCRSTKDITSASAVAFSSDGKTVAVGGSGGRVALFKASTLTLITSFVDPGTDGVVAVAISPNGKTVAAGDDNGNTYLWNVATGKAVTLPDPKSQGVRTVVFSPDGNTLAVADLNGNVYLWDAAGGKRAGTLTDPGSTGVDSMALSPDGRALAAGDFNGRTYLWDVATRTVARTYPDPATVGVNAVAFSPDGKFLVAADEAGAVFLWDAGVVHLVDSLDIEKSISVLAFSPDSKTLATGDVSGDLTLWHI